MEVDAPVKQEDQVEDPDNEYDRSQLPHLLKLYYKSLFPYDKYFEWLQYGNDNMFSHREFSFTLEDDVYVRYQSFDSQESLEEGIKKANPYKIDIGAMFNSKPCMHNRVPKGNFRAMRKELVFDIDMTDYDDIRTCCKEAQICPKCWKFITIAIRIIDRALREDFGFKHLLWVYSGRRGVHCWVCDKRAIDLSQEARVAIVEYLTLIKGGEQQVHKVKIPRNSPIHPSISSALVEIEKYFNELLVEQEFFETPDQWKKVLKLLPKKMSDELDREWNEEPASTCDKWRRLKTVLAKDEILLYEIMLQWSYPRLDVNVSKGINHLLKSPMCVHPKTGRVCVPIETGKDMDKLDSFDPFAVPTIKQICDEFVAVKDDGGSSAGYNKTSLGSYMQYFHKGFLLDLKKDIIKQRKEDQKGSMVF